MPERSCPSCNAPVQQNDRFCQECGAAVFPADAAGLQAAVQICGSCNAVIVPGDRFCQSCGKATDEGSASPQPLAAVAAGKPAAAPFETPAPKAPDPSRGPAAAPGASGKQTDVVKVFYFVFALVFVLLIGGYTAYRLMSGSKTPAEVAAMLATEEASTSEPISSEAQPVESEPSAPFTESNKTAEPVQSNNQAGNNTAPPVPKPAATSANAPSPPKATTTPHSQDGSGAARSTAAATGTSQPASIKADAPVRSTAQPATSNVTAEAKTGETSVPTAARTAAATNAAAPFPPSGAVAAKTSATESPANSRSAPASASPIPTIRATPQEGVIYWTGKLQKGQIITITDGGASTGFADGQLLPGVPVDVHIFSPAIVLTERPGPSNGWKKVAFRCERSLNRSVTLNIQWNLRP